MNTIHDPGPKFVDNLEQALRSTIRRQGRFGKRVSARGVVAGRPRWTTGVVAVAALFVGSAGTLAVTQRLRSQTADLIIARADAHQAFADARLDLFREQFQETESRGAAGALTQSEVDSMRLELVQVEAEAAARTLDVEESRMTGVDPDNSLSAPILRGRDFVTERLELERGVLLQRVALLEKQASRAGLTATESGGMRQELGAARAALSIVEERLALRGDYLSGVHTARQVELADIRFSVRRQREIAAGRVAELQPKLDRMHALVEGGMASRSEARGLEMEFRAAQLQVDLAELEIQILESKLGDSSGQ
ncbi:MAG: hypothetical protein PVI86_16830 [Phycisphaerae bacterium]|jgi:hypothetical protein